MRTLTFAFPEFQDMDISNPESPIRVWLEKLYEALRPLHQYKLINGQRAVQAWIRSPDGGSEPVETEQEYGHGGYDRCEEEQDSSNQGWWVFAVHFHYPEGTEGYDVAEKVQFFSKDFTDSELLKKKFEIVLTYIRENSSPPPFSPERIKQALETLGSSI